MGRIGRIWFCGYRDWALSLYAHACSHTGASISLIKDGKDFAKRKSEFDKDDLFLFIGWSWILPKEIVDKYTCVCLHPSPLPKYRGGSPLQHQHIKGETDSAATFFLMNEHLDKGPILYTESFSLDGSLSEIYDRIVKCGRNGIDSLIGQFLAGTPLIGEPQDESAKTYYKRRTPSMSEIKIEEVSEMTAMQIYNKVRALQDPYPNAYIRCKDDTILLLKTVAVGEEIT